MFTQRVKANQPRSMRSLTLRRFGAGARLILLVCLGAASAAAQAAAEYGGAVASAGVRASAIRFPKIEFPAIPPSKSASTVHLTAPPTGPTVDVEAANRKALEASAGKDAAKLRLRSTPGSARVRIDGKPVGRTPLVLVVAPGAYNIEMESAGAELTRSQVNLLPQETREIEALQLRYPTKVQLSWPSR